MSVANVFSIHNHIWDSRETLPRDSLAALQLKRLKNLVDRVSSVPFYRGAFARHGVTPDGIHSLDDLARLPFTTNDDLRLRSHHGPDEQGSRARRRHAHRPWRHRFSVPDRGGAVAGGRHRASLPHHSSRRTDPAPWTRSG